MKSYFPSLIHFLPSPSFNCQLKRFFQFWFQQKVKVKVTLRLAVYGQSVYLGVKPLETHDQRFFFFPTKPLRYQSLCNILSDEKMTYSMLLKNYWFCTTHKPSVSTGFPAQVKVKVTLRLTVSQSVSLGVKPNLGPMTRYLLLCDSYGLVLVGRPLWREDGCLFLCAAGTWDHILLSQVWDFPFRRLLWLAGSRWRYSTPPPHGELAWDLRYIASERIHRKHRFHRYSSTISRLLHAHSLQRGRVYRVVA
jgi:hypothetical protein